MYQYGIVFVVWDWLIVSDIGMSLCFFLGVNVKFIITVRFPKIILRAIFLVEHPTTIKLLNVFYREKLQFKLFYAMHHLTVEC